jgi:prevent-host-death family protein
MCYMPRYKIKNPDSSVGVRELRQNLSVYLERVKKGEALTVTDRGEEVAILRPMPKTNSVIDRLIAEGRATPAKRHIRDVIEHLRKVRQPWQGETPLAEVLDEIREDRI